MARIKRGELVVKTSYPDTLKAIPVGESRVFDAYARTYNAMRTAASRLNSAGKGVWSVELVGQTDVKVTRIA